MKHALLLCLSLALALSFAGCQTEKAAPVPSEPGAQPESPASSQTAGEGTTVTAMFVLLGREEDPDGYMLFDQDTGEAFSLGGVGELYEDGAEFDWRDYATGNILELTFGPDWITAEIWPAIYYGLDSVTLLEEGDPADAEQYADTIAQFYDPQPQEPPILNVSWRETFEGSGLAVGTSVTTFRCQYHYVDLEDQPGVTEIDLGEPMEQDIRELELEAPTQVELSLYKTQGDWALERWPQSDPAAPPEPVELTQEDDPTARQCAAEPGWVYHLTVQPEEGGTLEYVFQG